MRVIGGRWGGRRLTPVGRGDEAARLRPTADRVREAIFNALAHGRHAVALDGARVLDAFAGTGALGFEACSRGAASVTFLETGRPALALLRANAALLGAPATIRVRDATRPGPGTPHDLLFLDPPYGRGLGERAVAALVAGGWLAPGATIVWEEAAPVAAPAGVALRDVRRYGDTVVTFAALEARPG